MIFINILTIHPSKTTAEIGLIFWPLGCMITSKTKINIFWNVSSPLWYLVKKNCQIFFKEKTLILAFWANINLKNYTFFRILEHSVYRAVVVRTATTNWLLKHWNFLAWYLAVIILPLVESQNWDMNIQYGAKSHMGGFMEG